MVSRCFDLDLELNDVVAFFLTAYLEKNEVVFMEQPESSDDKSGRICRLRKSMYGLPQTAYHAQQKLMKAFKADNLLQCVSDRAVGLFCTAGSPSTEPVESDLCSNMGGAGSPFSLPANQGGGASCGNV